MAALCSPPSFLHVKKETDAVTEVTIILRFLPHPVKTKPCQYDFESDLKVRHGQTFCEPYKTLSVSQQTDLGIFH